MSANRKKIAGSILLSLGVVLIVFGSIVSGKVDQGKRKIQNAQRGVNTVRSVTGVTRYSEDIGNAATLSVQNKINSGKTKVKKFNALSLIMLILGTASSLIGSILLYKGFHKD